MKEKQGFIAEYRKGEATMSSLCRRFMISRKTGYQWVRRFEGPGGWDGQARRGGRRPWVITPAVAEAILNLRAQYPLEGPKKLVVRLTRQERRRPSASAIGEFLRRNGLVAKRRRRRHPAPMSQPFAEVIEPNDLMTVDRKGWFRTGNHQKCEPLTVMDSASRYLLYNRHLKPVSYQKVRAIFERLFQLHGLPKAIRTDNGPPFAGVGLAGLSKLSVWWKRLGIKHERIAPAHPEQNGRHERMHLTLKQHACAPVARDLKRQQKVLEQFRVYYNTDRPHEALGQVTPASRYYRSPRPYPARLAELRYPPKFEVRKVLGNGMIKWRGRAIYLSQTLGGERIGLDRSAVGSWPVYFATERLGEIDPARARFSRYEPQPRSARASEKHAVPRAAKRPRPSSSNQASLLEWSSSTTEPGAIFPPPSEASERAAEKLPVITSTKPVTHLPVQSVTHFPVAQG
jgi:transposase InsO family protein